MPEAAPSWRVRELSGGEGLSGAPLSPVGYYPPCYVHGHAQDGLKPSTETVGNRYNTLEHTDVAPP